MLFTIITAHLFLCSFCFHVTHLFFFILQSKLSLLSYKVYRVQTKHVNNAHVTALPTNKNADVLIEAAEGVIRVSVHSISGCDEVLM